MLSRCFERQADVFAARTMERELADEARGPASHRLRHQAIRRRTLASEAHLFASALHRVAVVNNIPVRANNFSHGSIAQRMMYLRELQTDPANTQQFDRFMRIVYRCLIAALIISLAWVAMMMFAA